MKHRKFKIALLLLIIAIVAGLVGTLACSIIGIFVESIASIMTIVSGGISLAATIITIVAYYVGSEDNYNFHSAFCWEIVSLVVAIVSIAFSVVLAFVPTAGWADWLSVTANAFYDAIGIVVFFYVCKACSSVCRNKGIKRLSNVSWAIYTVAALLAVVCDFKGLIQHFEVAFLVVVIVSLVAAFVAQLMEIILIGKTFRHLK